MLSRLVVVPGSAADLERRDPRDTLGPPGKDEAKQQLASLFEELSSLLRRERADPLDGRGVLRLPAEQLAGVLQIPEPAWISRHAVDDRP
ncbi:MAG: hypothetical protein QOF68_577 [Gaiellales bacterium]|nr:hypothetical protein [Gaiellales bacterium]